MKLLSLFSGIGAFEKALENLGISYELVNYCEIDKYASKSYALLHNVSETKNLWDVTKINTKVLPRDIDLLTYGFPCQDISLAGKQLGLEDNGTKTRSGLVWDAHKVIGDLKPKVAVCENVKNLTSKRFANEFKAILANLESLGYVNYWKVLNAKDFGVPQQRERVFIVSIRKDLAKGFEFPLGIPLTKHFVDYLDIDFEPKYFLAEKALLACKKNFPSIFHYSESSNFCNTVKRLGGIYDSETRHHQMGSVYSINALAPTLDCVGGGNRQPLIPTKSLLQGTCVRRTTPFEFFKLMGFTKEDALLLRNNKVSDTQLYKMVGNSIVVPILEAIFKQLYKTEELNEETTTKL